MSLGMRFRRLFELVVDKSCTMSHMSSLGCWGHIVEVEEMFVGLG